MKNTWSFLFGCFTLGVVHAETMATTNTPAAIPWSRVGAKAGADHAGDGLALAPSESGARLHCLFQRLDGEATPQGLWLSSTVTNAVSERFQVTAREVGRKAAPFNSPPRGSTTPLDRLGRVSLHGQTVRFSRPGLMEEYSVSMDGVRQDFVVEQAPPNPAAGELMVRLAVTGAEAEPAAYGARLRLRESGRQIAYSRVRASDATGKELPARLEVCPGAEVSLAVVVNDAQAVYPVRIDPTFSDANWVSLGGLPGVDATVYASVVDGSGNLYIGGDFIFAGNVMANDIARWNGSQWSVLGSGMNSRVFALAVSGGALYAGGDFTMAGGNPANYIAQWDGSTWWPLGSGMNGQVLALVMSPMGLYAGGDFTTAGGNAAVCIAQWGGGGWSAVGNAVESSVWALAYMGDKLYAGSLDIRYGTNTADVATIGQWDGTNWTQVGEGLSGYVHALAVSGNTLYAGGEITASGWTNVLNYIAQWDGTSWSALGSGMNDIVRSLAVWGGTLYAGGQFTTAGGNAANHIARWNGSWSALGSGIGSNVQDGVEALAVWGGTVYAGGGFATAGTNVLNHIGQWNGSRWSALGPGMNGDVEALAVSGGTLYAGGGFTMAGTNAANYIAQWNGSSWSALGPGMNSNVLALAVSGGTLYAGGGFTMAGTNAANYIAQWNGSSWSPLGSGMGGANCFVSALAASGGTLYAGGYFKTAGANAATNIAQWDGSGWSALGSGIGGDDFYPYIYPRVDALAASGGRLYAGGWFLTAGTNVSVAAAEAIVGGAPVSLAIIPNNGDFGFTNGVFGFDLSGPAGSNVVIETSTNLRSWTPLRTNLLGSGLLYFSDSQSRTTRQRFYRAEMLP